MVVAATVSGETVPVVKKWNAILMSASILFHLANMKGSEGMVVMREEVIEMS